MCKTTRLSELPYIDAIQASAKRVIIDSTALSISSFKLELPLIERGRALLPGKPSKRFEFLTLKIAVSVIKVAIQVSAIP